MRAGVVLSPIQPLQGRGGGTWLQQEMVPLCLGTSRVHQEGKNCSGKEESHSASQEWEMMGVTPGCSPAPELQDCQDSCILD